MIDPILNLLALYSFALFVNIHPIIFYIFSSLCLIIDINSLEQDSLLWATVSIITISRVLTTLLFQLKFQNFNIGNTKNKKIKIGYVILFINAVILYIIFYTQFGPYWHYYNARFDNYNTFVDVIKGIYYGSFRYITFNKYALTESAYIFSKYYLQVAIIYNFIEIF
jgi:hypothetical protein